MSEARARGSACKPFDDLDWEESARRRLQISTDAPNLAGGRPSRLSRPGLGIAARTNGIGIRNGYTARQSPSASGLAGLPPYPAYGATGYQ